MSLPELVPGAIVGGRYAVKALLGRSPVAVTYQALTTPNREVALKIYDTALWKRPDVVAGLQRVAMAARELPNHVAMEIFEDGVDEELGAPFVVSELCATPPLAQLVGLCPLAPPEAVTLMLRLSQALDMAHARGLPHLDLKPDNVFVGPPPHYAVRLSDFASGIAAAPKRTDELMAWAAPWLAPEQTVEGQPAGPAADVFSAALVIYFALTGHSFWRSCDGAVDLAAWRSELAAPRASVSARALESRVTLVTGLDAVFQRALAQDPGRRYATVGELATAFAEAVSGRQMEAQVETDWVPAPSLGGRALSNFPSEQEPHSVRPNIATSWRPPTMTGTVPPPAWTGSGAMGSLPPLAALGSLPPPGFEAGTQRGNPLPEAEPGVTRRASSVMVLGGVAGIAVLSLVIGAVALLRSGARSDPPRAIAAPGPVDRPATAAAPQSPPSSAAAPEPAKPAEPAKAPEPARTADPVGPIGALDISCTPACSTVLIDLNPVTLDGTPIKLSAGPHTVSVVSVNGRRKLLSINLQEGRVERMIFQLGKQKQ